MADHGLVIALTVFLLFAVFTLVALEWIRRAKDDAIKALDEAAEQQKEVKRLLDELGKRSKRFGGTDG